MSTTTIYASDYTFILLGDSSPHGGASKLATYFPTYKYLDNTAGTGLSAAIVQFTRPSALKYAQITSATLKFTTDMETPAGVSPQLTNEVAVAKYSTQSQMSSITWSNLKSLGSVGDWTLSGQQQGSAVPFNSQISVTSAYTSGLSEDKITFLICVGRKLTDIASSYYAYVSASSCRLDIEYEAGAQPAPTPLYPKDITLVEPSSMLFSWQFNGATEAVQTAAVLQYKTTDAENYTEVSLTQSGYSYTLNQALPVGTYQWRVKVTNDAGTTSSFSADAYFQIVGKPASPIINEPDNKALTTITWNTENQQACEIILADQSGKELYHENLATGETIYKPNFFLSGAYMFSVRVMNESQMWSDWAQRAFNITAAGPTAATISLATAADVSTVHLTFTIPNDVQAVLMRSQGGHEKVLSMLEQFDTEYIDTTVASGITYTYWIRTYVDGYTDSDPVETSVHFEGAIISSDDVSLELNRSDDQFLPYAKDISREFSLMQFSGREFPMIERGEFTTIEFSRRFHITNAQEEILDELSKEEKVFYRDTKNHAYPSALKRVHYDSYMADGYLVTLDFVRLNEEEVVVNV